MRKSLLHQSKSLNATLDSSITHLLPPSPTTKPQHNLICNLRCDVIDHPTESPSVDSNHRHRNNFYWLLVLVVFLHLGYK
ncbi:hypothetical protein QVD17_26635 [Tagetes erecta]|uniref:Transmembrane protein n=1 Tax=Tagetes erecta TaxID=13708 RepID=A0AAD8KAG3_TARER|nr:hypothetical protein QVD17_26635 [Tagetes erecta]